MSWNEEIRGISLGTLFKFYGKNVVASILWVIIFYLILMIPMFALMGAMAAWMPW